MCQVTIITVCYNSVKTIEETILSVVNQTYSNIEYIIVDGGSTDGTLNIINKYIDFPIKLISEKDEGIYDAMNKGIQNAKGDLIALLNSDDSYISNESIEEVIRYFDTPETIIASDVIIETKEGNKLFSINENRKLWINIPYMHTGIFIPKVIYEKYGLFDLKYSIASDIDFIMRLMKEKVDFISTGIPVVKMSDGGISNTQFEKGRKEYCEIYRKYYKNHIKGLIGYLYSILEFKAYNNDCFKSIYRYLKRRNRDEEVLSSKHK